MSAPVAVAGADAAALEEAFSASREAYQVLEAAMCSPEARGMDHGQLEEHLAEAGREFLRVMFQSHLALRALTEQRAKQAVDAEGIGRNWIERGRCRELSTLFGPVTVARIAYRGQYVSNLAMGSLGCTRVHDLCRPLWRTVLVGLTWKSLGTGRLDCRRVDRASGPAVDAWMVGWNK